MSKKFPIEMTVHEIVGLADLAKAVHTEQAYYAERRLDETEDGWLKESIRAARAKQATMSRYHELLTGEPLEPTPEKAPTPVDADA